MRARIVMLFVVLFVLAGCSSGVNSLIADSSAKRVSDAAFSAAWNNNCGNCSFEDNRAATLTTTLGDMYCGSDFSIDIERLDILISIELGEPSGLDGASETALYVWYDSDGDGELE
ncbi:hypothetical protein JW859_03830 [bacterium]|nr:hypothetical protein [bacterium]